MLANNCEFCNLTNEDKKWLLCESSYWDIYLADRQDYIGRCIIVLKRHCGSLSQLESAEWIELKSIIEAIETIMQEVLGADLCNWSCLMNDFYKNDTPNPHLHIHVRPRCRNPITVGGKLFYDREFGHHYDNQKSIQLSVEETECLYRKLRPEFDCLCSDVKKQEK